MGNVCNSGIRKEKDTTSENSFASDIAFRNEQLNQNSTEEENLVPKIENKCETDKSRSPDKNEIIISDIQQGMPKTTDTTLADNSLSANKSDPKILSTSYLALLEGKGSVLRNLERNNKIVMYVLSDNCPEHAKFVQAIYNLQEQLREQCLLNGFEMLIANVHCSESVSSECNKIMPYSKWSQSPLEAQGGHEEAANCLAEIMRHSSVTYVVPILFLGSSLGRPMLPLTIESQDFNLVLTTATNEERECLEKWYIVDDCYQPMCHRLNGLPNNIASSEVDDELNGLYNILLRLFSTDLKDSYMTTVVEQEINNTVLMSQELAKRCIWIQNESMNVQETVESPHSFEVRRRLSKLYTELKLHLSEKNVIRIFSTVNNLESDFDITFKNTLLKIMHNVFSEHDTKVAISHNTNGIDKILLDELQLVGQFSNLLAQNSPNFDIMLEIKRYIMDSTGSPLIVSGPRGCGKSVFISKIVENIYRWRPELNLIVRYANLSARSFDLTSILGSIANQISGLMYGRHCVMEHTIQAYSCFIRKCIESKKCPIVIIIDSIDDIIDGHNISWLPTNISNTCKILITVTQNDDGQESSIISNFANAGIPKRCFIRMKKFTERQWQDILSAGGGDFYAANGALKIPNEWKTLRGKTPFHAKSLWWLAWLGYTSISTMDISEVLENILHVIELIFSRDYAEILLLILALPQWGVQESECINIFRKTTDLDDQKSFRIWAKFCWLMGPMLIITRDIRLADKPLKDAIVKRYKTNISRVHQIFKNFYTGQDDYMANFHNMVQKYNSNKFLKLPYHHFCDVIEDNSVLQKADAMLHCYYLTDLIWIADKIQFAGADSFWADLKTAEKICGFSETPYIHIHFLINFIEKNMYALSYDGQQFYTLFKYYLKFQVKSDKSANADNIIRTWSDTISALKIPFLEILNTTIGDVTMSEDNVYDALVNLPNNGFFVSSLSTKREEICVWDVKNCARVRMLKGISQPSAICPFGLYNAAVLCGRQIKVIDLDVAKLKVSLKGVMNQKMPFFGLHDQKHLVCLSRNRMYVNLMNLETGDCVTTFKAGEDRFLNSLLVSGDGRILVCGDETQKPFPLLVWHLTQKKLMYDLRIPHHDFVTSLSAITHEGSYVSVVAKELNETTPNFIVVYDLQSGTLFKKWKPQCNTTSLAISQANACVIAGLEDAKIQIWDLITGNCRTTLIGHNAPVTTLKLDPMGKVLLSTDERGRDNALRIWELCSGKLVATFKPTGIISACEILPNGAYVVVAIKNQEDLLMLALNNFGHSADITAYATYGCPENQGGIFKLNTSFN